MNRKHPAVQAYENVWQRIVDNKDDAGLMPQGSGDVVGRARHEAEMKRMGIQYPENFIDQMNWLEEVGVIAAAMRLTRRYNRMRKQNAQNDPQFSQVIAYVESI